MMVMHGQTDFMDLLLGSHSDVVNSDGEVNFYVPQSRELDDQYTGELDQQLDMDEYMYPDVTTLPILDILDDDCSAQTTQSPAHQAVPHDTPSTSDLEGELYFQYPVVGEFTEISMLVGAPPTNTEASYTNQFFSTETPLSPTSPADSVFTAPPTPSTTPPTPSTGSSTDSGWGGSSGSGSSIKDEVKARIQNRRRREGKTELQVEFLRPEPEQLTAEEEEKRIERKEKNKLAAQKCRGKKREKADLLEDETKILESKGDKMRIDIQKLLQERDHLKDILSIHAPYCPKMRGCTASY